MGSEKPHPFDAILANAETSNTIHAKEISIDGTICDIRWRDSEPDNWTVYINGLPFAVSKRNDESFRVTDASLEPYDAVVTKDNFARAIAAVRQLLNIDKTD